MAVNEVFRPGERLDVPVPAGVISGDPVVVDKINGVAQTNRHADGTVSLDLIGVHELTVQGAVTFGQAIYAVVAAGLVTQLNTTASGNSRFGTAFSTQTATGKVRVRLVQG